MAAARFCQREFIPIQGVDLMKVMIRRSPETGLSIYVPKKDLEEPIVEFEHEQLWGGWIKIANGWVLDLPQMAAGTTLPITVNARKRGQEGEES
jgi:nitrogen fixation protein NifT